MRDRGLVLAAALVSLLFVPVTSARAEISAQGCSARAVVVVEPGPGAVVICFDGSISGLEALQLAGANPVTYGFAGQGAAVCQLYGVGNPGDSSCLLGPGGQYWAYYRATPGATGWTYSRAGASTTTVTNGSVEGWRYGTGAAPGFVSFCSVVTCAPPPTSPPPVTQTAPPATVAPLAAAPATAAPSGTTPSTAGNGKAADAGKGSGAKSDGSGSKGTRAEAGKGTTTTRKSGTNASDRKPRSGTAEVAAGGTGGGSDGGSPVGVIVALAVVAAAVAGGLLLRRHRRGPAPG